MKYFSAFTSGLLAFFLLLTIPLAALAQAPEWQIPVAISPLVTTNHSQVKATAADANGNVYIAGLFAGTVSFGSISLNSVGGSNDVFVAKWNTTSRSFVWAQRAGGPGNDVAGGLAVQGTNIYVAGSFTSATANFGSLLLTNSGSADVFVAKLTDAGLSAGFAWVQRGGGIFRDEATALAVSGPNVYVAGGISGSSTFGNTTLLTSGGSSMFVAKLTDTGNTGRFDWALNSDNANYCRANALAVNGPNVYVTGNFSFTSRFGSSTLSSAGFDDLFVAKVTDAGLNGSFTWAQQAGGTDDEYVSAVAVSGANVYLAGSFKSSAATFGTASVVVSSPGDYAVFVAKLTDTGAGSSFTWARSAGGPGDDEATALAVEGNRIYIAGYYFLSAVFDTNTLNGSRFKDVFVARLTDAGSTASFAWVQQAGGDGYDSASALAVQGTNVYVGGSVEPPASFGGHQLTGLRYVDTGFLASLTDNTTTATADPMLLNSLAFYPNPARTTVQVPAATRATMLTLLDALGRKVRTTTGSTLSVQGVAPGLYILRAATPGQPMHTARLEVE